MKNGEYFDTVSNKFLKKYVDYHHMTNSPIGEYYYLNDQLHRKNGPAVMWYDKDGNIEKRQYYINGIECDVLQEVVIQGLEKEQLV